MQLSNCHYNKIKLLHELSAIVWFIQKHALQNATQASEKECVQLYQQLEKDLTNTIAQLHDLMCKNK